MFVYVISKKGNVLMPCKPAIARLLLKENKVKVKKRMPFTIKLTIDSTEYVQPVIGGMDTGSKTIGSAAIANGQVVYQSEITIRNDVSKKMQRRAMCRRNRRGRKCRYRPARWLNRANSKRDGRLAPSLISKIDSHLREKKQMESILPISAWHVETASFDIHKITNPDVKKWEYQDGKQKGYYNLKAYVLDRDNYKCQCKRGSKCETKKGDVLEVHHIVFRSKGGTNAPSNLIALGKSCHASLHAGKFDLKAKKSITKHATEMGIVKSQLKEKWNFVETFGYATKFKREQILQLPKSHANDAIAICCEDGELVNPDSNIFYKRHVSSGDFQQTKGVRSQMRIPTGKLFGFRKHDYIKTSKGEGFIKGKRSSGYFALGDIHGKTITASVSVKKNAVRITARSTTLTSQCQLPPAPKESGYPLGQHCARSRDI